MNKNSVILSHRLALNIEKMMSDIAVWSRALLGLACVLGFLGSASCELRVPRFLDQYATKTVSHSEILVCVGIIAGSQ